MFSFYFFSIQIRSFAAFLSFYWLLTGWTSAEFSSFFSYVSTLFIAFEFREESLFSMFYSMTSGAYDLFVEAPAETAFSLKCAGLKVLTMVLRFILFNIGFDF